MSTAPRAAASIGTAAGLEVVTVDPATHLAAVEAFAAASHPGGAPDREVSFLQCPSWGSVKSDWRPESVLWRDASGAVVGAGLVLYRKVPRLPRYLAYLPEGPVIEWSDPDLHRWLDPLVAHVRSRGAFALRMGPPVVRRRWHTETVKAALADAAVTRLGDVAPDEADPVGESVVAALRDAGWRPPPDEEGFGAGQPRHVFQVPLAGRTEEELLAGFNQLWRRNIRKADKAGVEVSTGGYDDLPAFHALYSETAARDHFTPRPLSYFQRMWRSLTAETPDRLRLYLARHEGDLVAATTMVTVGAHAWYSYGASSTAKREVRASNAVQWRMMRDALASGAAVYDLRGITDTLREDDPHVGLVQFKLGTGGQAVEYAGEWELAINRLLSAGFDLYLRRRG